MRLTYALAIVAVVGFLFLPEAHATAPNIPGFQITGSITVYHFENIDTEPAGQKTPITKLSAAVLAACITGSGVNCTSGNLELDSGGKAYLFIETKEKAWIATNNTCTNATQMDGLVGGDGSFMFSGHHEKSDTDFVVQGKVSFLSGTFTPTSIKKASIMAIGHPPIDHYAIGTFATVGSVFGIPAGTCGP
jgi:hypothetical protein